MSNKLSFQGLDEFRRQLRELPAELTAEASNEVRGAANGAAAEMKRNYPVHEGKLRDGVSIDPINAGRYGAGVIVKNTAKHAHIFENGSQTRRTRSGANRGAMPPGHVFVPAAIRARRTMFERLKAIVARAGFKVSGDAG